MFTDKELELIKQSYFNALERDLLEYNEPETKWDGMSGLYEVFDLSSEECAVNILFEDMTEEEYENWGPPSKERDITLHYAKHDALKTIEYSNGLCEVVPDRSQSIPPFSLKKETVTPFTLSQRRFVLNLLHHTYEKESMTKEEMLKLIGIL